MQGIVYALIPVLRNEDSGIRWTISIEQAVLVEANVNISNSKQIFNFFNRFFYFRRQNCVPNFGAHVFEWSTFFVYQARIDELIPWLHLDRKFQSFVTPYIVNSLQFVQHWPQTFVKLTPNFHQFLLIPPKLGSILGKFGKIGDNSIEIWSCSGSMRSFWARLPELGTIFQARGRFTKSWSRVYREPKGRIICRISTLLIQWQLNYCSHSSRKNPTPPPINQCVSSRAHGLPNFQSNHSSLASSRARYALRCHE